MELQEVTTDFQQYKVDKGELNQEVRLEEEWAVLQVYRNITVAPWVVVQSLVQLVALQWVAVVLEANQYLL
jgi:hypothetical protein